MSIKLCEGGKAYMNKQRKKKGWNKVDYRWQDAANVSESTLKRFWGMTKKDGVAPDTFKAICEAAGVDEVEKLWDLLVEGDKTDSTRVPFSTLIEKNIHTKQPKTSKTQFTVTVKGIGLLNKNEQLQVKANLDYLEKVLMKPYMIFSKIEELNIPESESLKAKFKITVTGVGFLDEDKELLVKATVEELETFLRNPYINIESV